VSRALALNLAELAAWRAEAMPDAEQCLLLFGVGPEVLERIERGEVLPSTDVAERIGRHTKLPGPDLDRSAGPINCAGGCPSPGAAGDFLGSGNRPAAGRDPGGGD
jgi:hypothetical protein